MLTCRRYVAGAALGDRIYAVGGAAGSGPSIHLSSVERYDPTDQTWTAVASMSDTRHSHAVAVLGGYLYAIGGMPSGSPTSSVEKYDPAADSWASVASLPIARFSLAAAALDGKVYAFGGAVYAHPYFVDLTTAEAYDPSTNAWTTLASLPTGRAELAAAAHGSKIYVFGGRSLSGTSSTELSVVEAYDPAADSWATVASMPTARRNIAAAPYGDKIYVLGGWNTAALSAVEVYDPTANTWTSASSMSTSRSTPAAAFLGGTLYAVGGVDTAGSLCSVESALMVSLTSPPPSPSPLPSPPFSPPPMPPGGYYMIESGSCGGGLIFTKSECEAAATALDLGYDPGPAYDHSWDWTSSSYAYDDTRYVVPPGCQLSWALEVFGADSFGSCSWSTKCICKSTSP